MRQHYLPRCYLNEFCGSNKSLYSLSIEPFKLGKTPAPKLKHPAEVCCEKNFYSVDFDKFLISQQLATAETFSVEKSFHWYENDYYKIIRKLKLGISLNYKDAYTLSYAFIDFKIRNKYWREKGIEDQKKSLINNTVTKIELPEELLKSFNISKEQALNTISKVKDKLIAENTFSKQMHLDGLLKSRDKRSVQHRIAENLLALKWKLRYSSKGEFITCDNPGVCVDHDERAHNTRFAPGFIFIIPLTPQYCLFIDDRDPDENFRCRSMKTLQTNAATPELIAIINRASIFYANKNILSNSMESLNNIIPDIQIKYNILKNE